jgi:hypothetical protein
MKCLAFVLLIVCIPIQVTAETQPIALTIEQATLRLWERRGPAIRFVRSTVEQQRFVQKTVPKLWRGLAPGAPEAKHLITQAQSVGLSIVAWTIEGELYWLLGDPEESVVGAGRYLFRAQPKADADRLLQAPHAFFDRHTGTIAAQMFFSNAGTSIRAFFSNSIHRYHESAGGQPTSGASPSDVCHNSEHLFSVATVAARKAGAALVLQLHGFADKAVDPDLMGVVSGGRHRTHSDDAARIAGRLRAVVGTGIKLFPDEVQLLGATQNVQGRLVRDRHGNGFVHIELSLKARESLLNNADLRAKMTSALLDGEARP